MVWKIMVIVSLEDTMSGSAISSQVVEFETREKADQAVTSVQEKDHGESYTQLEAVKLY